MSISTIDDRFEANVDRRGDHHLWLGYIAPDGTPQVRVDGRLTTARRVARQLARGALPEHATVAACPESAACVRVEHLTLRVHDAPPHLEGDTVDELIDRYLDFLIASRGRQHSTVLRYRTLYATWLSPRLGRLSANALRSEHAQRALNRMRKAGQSTSSIHQAFLVLNGACKWAVVNCELQINPMIEVSQPAGVAARNTTSSEAWDLPAVVSAAFAYDHDFGVACVVAAATGMGRGELAGLRWDRVDLERRRIEVCLAVNDAGGRLVMRDLTGTTRERTVEIAEATIAVLDEHRDHLNERARACGTQLTPDGFVFSQVPDGSEPIGPSYLTRRFRQLTHRLGRQSSDFDTVLRTAEPA